MADLDRYRQELRKQLDFLNRSCASFDQGYQDEAVRLAVAIRVLIHNTQRSTSLLTHLDARNIRLLTQTPIEPEGDPAPVLYMAGFFSDGKYTANLGAFPPWIYLLVDEWWQQGVEVVDQRWISRKQIVLAAANKDGGAHVDEELDGDYAKMFDRAKLCTVHTTMDREVSRPACEHWIAIRQMSFELLNSPELLALLAPLP